MRVSPVTGRAYGYRRDLEDRRDLEHLFRVAREIALTETNDLREFASPIRDQGQLGSCTAYAICAIIEWEAKRQGITLDLSELFLYLLERMAENSVAYDSGAMLRDGLDAAKKMGVATEAKWPYLIAKFAKTPPKAVFTDAAKHTIGGYTRVPDFAHALQVMAGADGQKRPVAFGMTVYPSFESIGPDGMMPVPKRGEKPLGGHAMSGHGHLSLKHELAIVKQSWGESFGDHGWIYVPFSELRKQGIDLWALKA